MSGRETVHFTFDGRAFEARPGETLAMALWRNGVRALRRSSREGAPRGMHCAMGACFDCLVRVEGRTERACLLPIREGLVAESGGRP
ncbi:MAG: (2Fe-2S)-binding protein [Planctomycetota bacterium]